MFGSAAIGLVAAIPAVMAFNYFNSKIRILNVEMENFSADFMNIVAAQMSGSMGMGSNNGNAMSINVTPLVDVMLVLLIIFMITAPMLNQGVEIDLREGRSHYLQTQRNG